MGKDSIRKKGQVSPRSALGEKTSALKPDQRKYECFHCDREMQSHERVLYVEEDVGRVFCSEDCILQYFSPEIERLEGLYESHRNPEDYTDEERDDLSHLRWTTLENPDQVWCEKTIEGDYRYTLISEYELEGVTLWCIAVTLFLNGEPSFLYLSFTTKDPAMVELFRKGEALSVQRFQSDREKEDQIKIITPTGVKDHVPFDGLAEPWTQDETLTAELRCKRGLKDIPEADFDQYTDYMEDTLKNPDEVWQQSGLFHFIKHYEDDETPFWYIVGAKELEEDDQLEIIDQMPTNDPGLVQEYRRGKKEALTDVDEETFTAELDSEPEKPTVH